MDNTLEAVIDYLNKDSQYRLLFHEVFTDSVITTKHFLKALAQYTVSLVSANSKYDQYVRGEVEFTAQEKAGLKLFKKHCNSCHKAPLFNSNVFASNGLSINEEFNDVGRYKITQESKDSLQFRIPTLRNIAYSFPYMHDGRMKTLKEVLNHYATGIDINSPYLSKKLKKKLNLSARDQKDIIAFLLTLSDREFLFNKKFSMQM
jgi:cytochrome c peroxidase